MSVLMPSKQLPLAINLKEEFDFKSFFFGVANQELESNLTLWLEGEGEPYLLVWSPLASGKTHLLHAISKNLSELNHSVCYIPMKEFINFSEEALEGLETFEYICIDDVHLLTNHPAWQEALFHLFNRVLSVGSRLLITADQPPSKLNFNLNDLKTRLRSGLIYKLKYLEDAEKKILFKHRAELRGFEIPDESVEYIFKRTSRNMYELMAFLDQLDKSSLAAQRKLTIPFIKTVIAQLEN